MPPIHQSFYRRPLVLALVGYALTLAVFFYFFPPGNTVAGVARGPAELEGTVADFPRPYGPGYAFTLSARRLNGAPFAADVLVTVLPQKAVQSGCPAGGRCAVVNPDKTAFDNMPAPEFKSRVLVSGELSEPAEVAGSGGFSRRRYLAAKGVELVIKSTGAAQAAPPPVFYRAVNAVRGGMLETFSTALGPERSAVVGGIVLGDRARLSDRLAGVFRDSGAMHLLVASGSNVGFVTVAVYFLCGLVMVRRQYAVIPAILCAGFYTLCAGADAPLVRAFIMACAAAAGFLLGRESGILNGLVLAALGILLFDPHAVLRADFVMSALASAGILMGLSAFPPDPKKRPAARYFITVFFMSCFAQLMLMPVLAAYFQRLSLAALFSNLLLVPLAGILMLGGVVTAGLFALPFKLPALAAAGVTAVIADAFIGLARFFAELPFAAVWVRSPGWGVTALYYCVLFSVFNIPLARAGRFAWKRVVGAGLLAFFIWLAVPVRYGVFASPVRGGGVLVFKGPGGISVLSGAGCDGADAARAVLAAGRKGVSVLLLSSLAPEYTAGLSGLDSITPVKNVILPYGPVGPELKSALAAITARGGQVFRVWPGDEVVLPAGAGKAAVRAEPGRITRGDGAAYTPAYYTGNAAVDALAYRVFVPGAEVFIGSDNRYAQLKP